MIHFTTEVDKIFDGHFVVNHKDGIKLHNEYYNLEWTTYKGNAVHALNHGLLKTGECSVASKIDDDTVRTICELLEENKSYKEIANIVGLDWNNYTKSLLVRIRLRIEWKDISKDYTFDTNSRLRKQSDEVVELICDGISKGRTTGEMYKEFGYNVPYQRFRKAVWNIRNRNTYNDISKNYKW